MHAPQLSPFEKHSFFAVVGQEMRIIMSSIPELPPPLVVQNAPGYNSWPFVQGLGNNKLVCAYSRGEKHSIAERCRGVYARTSLDNGQSWTDETMVVNTPEAGESAIGKGLDADGAMLLWVRCVGDAWRHDLYRSTDGVSFQNRLPQRTNADADHRRLQRAESRTDVILVRWAVSRGAGKLTGTLTSADNGLTRKQSRRSRPAKAIGQLNNPAFTWAMDESSRLPA